MDPVTESERLERLRRMSEGATSWNSASTDESQSGTEIEISTASGTADEESTGFLVDDPSWDGDEDPAGSARSVGQARDDFIATLHDLPTADLAAIFPARDVNITVAEGVDDLVPLVDRAGIEAVEAALALVEDGLAQCAQMKSMAQATLPPTALRQILREIRSDKDTILRLRGPMMSRKESLDREAKEWSDAGLPQPTGFAAMFAKPGDARRAADQAKKMKEQNEETNRIIAAGREEVMRKQRESWDRQHEAFLRRLRGSRY